MGQPHWLFLEPYYGGSHRHLVDGLVERLPIEATVWTLAPRKWKWRMRGAALHFAQRWRQEQPRVDGIFATSMVHVGEFLGLLPAGTPRPRVVLYFHENQLAYPDAPRTADDPRDFHFGWSQALAAASADSVLWNSQFNFDSFLTELDTLIRRLPDERPRELPAMIRRRSQIVPVPIDVPAFRRVRKRRQGPARILWNHRWEHDKAPEVFFAALDRLIADGIDFEVSVLGPRFRHEPPVFELARQRLGARVRHWGFEQHVEDYRQALADADIAVSTARQEFQGLSVLEAAAAGAVPLVPDDLSYREIWPGTLRYPPGGLARALTRNVGDIDRLRRLDTEAWVAPFDWDALLPRYAESLASPLSAQAEG